MLGMRMGKRLTQSSQGRTGITHLQQSGKEPQGQSTQHPSLLIKKELRVLLKATWEAGIK
jgi:hypothetical protein